MIWARPVGCFSRIFGARRLRGTGPSSHRSQLRRPLRLRRRRDISTPAPADSGPTPHTPAREAVRGVARGPNLRQRHPRTIGESLNSDTWELLLCAGLSSFRHQNSTFAVVRSSVVQVPLCPDCGKTLRVRADNPSFVNQLHVVCDSCGAVWILDRTDRTKPPCLGRAPTPEKKRR